MIRSSIRLYCLLAVGFVPAIVPCLAWARTWKDKTGQFSVEADLMTVVEGSVHLRKSDGKTLVVPLDRLSVADREFVASNAAGKPGTKPAGNLPAGSAPPAIAPFDAVQAKAHQAAWAKHLGVPVELKNSIGMKLVLLPAGEFDMGTPDSDRDVLPREKPQHRVQITKPFYLGCHEVSVGQFRQFVSDSGYKTDTEQDGKGGQGFDGTTTGKKKPEYSWRNPGFQQTDEHPVVNVSWNDADAFCTWLSRKEGKAHSTPTSQTAHDFSRVRSVRTPQSESCTAQESHATTGGWPGSGGSKFNTAGPETEETAKLSSRQEGWPGSGGSKFNAAGPETEETAKLSSRQY